MGDAQRAAVLTGWQVAPDVSSTAARDAFLADVKAGWHPKRSAFTAGAASFDHLGCTISSLDDLPG